jgi:hypothetical protein
MRVRLPVFSWRITVSALLSLIVLVAVLGVVGAQSSNSNRATSKPALATLSGQGSRRCWGSWACASCLP